MNLLSYLTEEQSLFCQMVGLTNFQEKRQDALEKFFEYANSHYIKGVDVKTDNLLRDFDNSKIIFDGGIPIEIGGLKEIILPTKIGKVERYSDNNAIKLQVFRFCYLPINGMEEFKNGDMSNLRLAVMFSDRGLIFDGNNVGMEYRSVDENNNEIFYIDSFCRFLPYANECYNEYIRLSRLAVSRSRS